MKNEGFKFVQAIQDIKDLSAYLFRTTFDINSTNNKYELQVAVYGIYECYVNGIKINDGFLNPYRSNADQIYFIDTYDITSHLNIGKNSICFVLGNGFANSSQTSWDFCKTVTAAKLAFKLICESKEILNSSSLKCKQSEIIFNDYHSGERVDARKIIHGWNKTNFDDSNWANVISCESPKGEQCFENYKRVKSYETLYPIKSFKGELGYIYDFGKSVSGLYELDIQGEIGKTIYVLANDCLLENKRIYMRNILAWNGGDEIELFADWLTLSGEKDHFASRFCYKGCRFIEIRGITEQEAKTVSIKLHAISSLDKRNGYFKCDNDVINKLQECVINSDLSNFIYFPTDCPHREKNGWTGDASISAEQMLLNFDCGDQFKNFLRQLAKAQDEKGIIPCICPTKTWGYAWGTGPGWDSVIFEMALRTYIYTGDKEILELMSPVMKKYLSYMLTKANDKGLYEFGLEDWCTVHSRTPIVITDTFFCYMNAINAAKIYNILGEKDNKDIAIKIAEKIKSDFLKTNLLDRSYPWYTQTWLAMASFANIYENKKDVKDLLLHSINCAGDHFDCGLFGTKFLFRELSQLGLTEFATQLIIQDSYPSYKTCFLDAGATTLFETFVPKGTSIFDLKEDFMHCITSFNHHMFGDISAFFYRELAGIKIDDVNTVNFKPNFTKFVKSIEASHVFKTGELKVSIKHNLKSAKVKILIPDGVTVNVQQLIGYKIVRDITKNNYRYLQYVKLHN